MAEQIQSVNPKHDVIKTSKVNDQEAMMNLIELTMLIDTKKKEFLSLKNRITNQILTVPNDKSRIVLFKYYAQNKTFEKIAVEEDKAYMTICRWHGQALVDFEKKFRNVIECYIGSLV